MPPPPISYTRIAVLRIAPLRRAEVPALCERVQLLVSIGGAEVVVCDVSGLTPDLDTVEALLRLHVTARRLGASLRLRRASRPLACALDACGLARLLP